MQTDLDKYLIGLNLATCGCCFRIIAVALEADLPTEKLHQLERLVAESKEILTSHIAQTRKEFKK